MERSGVPLFIGECAFGDRAFELTPSSSVFQFRCRDVMWQKERLLNLAIERMVTLRGYRFALRGGMDNVTNQSNATAVNNVTGAPQFLQFLGDEGRHFVVRIRFFGRAGVK